MKDFVLTRAFKKIFKTQRALFTFSGAAFGATFPIGAIIIDWLIHDYPFDLVQILNQNPLHYLIATAPIVLGSLARLAGIRDDRIQTQTQEIESMNLALSSQNQEMEDIFGNIDQGILTINSDYSINKQYSKFLEKIFNRENLDGVNFVNLLFPIGPAKEKKDLHEYIDLLFSKNSANDDVLRDLNPIAQIEYAHSEEKGEVNLKYLVFDFVRIVMDGEVQKIMIIIKDLTLEINKEREHQKERREHEEELERISAIIQISPEDLDDFILKYENIAPQVERLFSSSPRNREEKEKRKRTLDDLLSQMHSLKGEARLANLNICAQKIHNLEASCRMDSMGQESKDNTKDKSINQTMEVMLALSEYKIAINALKETRDKLAEKLERHSQGPKQEQRYITDNFLPQLQELQQNLSRILDNYDSSKSTAKPSKTPGKSWIQELDKFAQSTCQELNKNGQLVSIAPLNIKNELVHSEINELSSIKSAIIQLIQNSLAHGIEQPLKRIKKGKKEKGNISLSFTKNNDNYLISVEDDGQGVNIEKIKSVLIKNNKVSAQEAEKFSAEEAVRYIFQSGFSSADSQSEIAGHGLGMDMVRRVIHKSNGKLSVRNNPDKGLVISIVVPIQSKHHENQQ